MSITRKPAVIATCAALAAAGGGAATIASSAGASTVGSGAASGTGTIVVTGPAGKTHTRTGAVTCKAVGGRYVVRAVSRRAHVRRVLRLIVRRYTGPGSYTGIAVLVHRHGGAFRGRVLKSVPVTITSTGGSFSYSRTLSGRRHPALKGKTIGVKASWTCSA